MVVKKKIKNRIWLLWKNGKHKHPFSNSNYRIFNQTIVWKKSICKVCVTSMLPLTSIQTFDFSTLSTSIPHQKLKARIHMLVNQTFLYKNGSRRYKHLVVNGDGTFFSNEEPSAGKKYRETLICQMIYFLIDNIYIKIGNHLFRQCIGIPMGANCAPLLANLLLYSYGVELLRSMKKSYKKLAKVFNLTLNCLIL